MAILIDLNDARKKLNELEGSAEYNKGVTDAFNALFDLPTIEAEPVIHGHWQDEASGRDSVCTVCRCYWIPSDAKYDFKYCPRCGAKMDEVENG